MDNLDKKIAEAKEIYERDGIAVIPGLFTQEEVNKIRGAAYMALTRLPHRSNLRRMDVDGVEFPALYYWIAKVDPFLNKMRCDERIQRVVRGFLGDNIKQLNNQVYYRLQGDQDAYNWHQDISFRTPASDYDQIEESYLQTLIVVDEITEDNGAVEYIPGSHKMGNLELVPRDDSLRGLRGFARGEREGVKYVAKPGDFMMWSVMIVHGSEKNETTDKPRMTYMNGFAKAEACKGNFPTYLKDGNLIKAF